LSEHGRKIHSENSGISCGDCTGGCGDCEYNLGAGELTPPGAPAPTMKTLDQVEPRTPIGSLPFTISQPGSYYLTGPLTSSGDGITVNSDNVTIDLMGFTIQGADAATGIQATPSSGGFKALTIKNGCVSRFSTGLYWHNVERSVLADLIVERNASHGIYIRGQFGPAGNNRIERCTIAKNGGCGLLISSYSIEASCNGNRIQDCSISQNTQSGVELDGSSSGQCDGNVFEKLAVNKNGASGVYLYGSSGSCKGNTIKGCNLEGNVESGIEISADCKQNRIEGNSVAANGKGLEIYGSGNYVADNVVAGNTDNYDFSQGQPIEHSVGRDTGNPGLGLLVKFAGSLKCAEAEKDGITVNANNVTIDLAGHDSSDPEQAVSGAMELAGTRTI